MQGYNNANCAGTRFYRCLIHMHANWCFQSKCSNISAEGLHFSAFHFVGISDSKESLQKLLDVVYSYCSKWTLRANVSKSAVMVFSKDAVNGCWKWGEYSLPIVSSYSYLEGGLHGKIGYQFYFFK